MYAIRSYYGLIVVSIWIGVGIVATLLNQGGVDTPMGRAAVQSATSYNFV